MTDTILSNNSYPYFGVLQILLAVQFALNIYLLLTSSFNWWLFFLIVVAQLTSGTALMHEPKNLLIEASGMTHFSLFAGFLYAPMVLLYRHGILTVFMGFLIEYVIFTMDYILILADYIPNQ